MNHRRQRLFRWLFRLKPDLAPVRLNQRRIYVLPSRFGLAYVVTLAAMLTGAVNYNLGLAHVLVFLLTGLGLATLLRTFLNLYGLTINAHPGSAVFAGESSVFPLQVDNPDHHPRRSLYVHPEGHPGLRFDAAPGSNVVHIPLLSQHRGYLRLPRLRLESRYPLGLVVGWSVFDFPRQALIYPRPFFLPLPQPSGSDRPGNQASGRGDDDFAGLRPRQATDPLHHVAWKAAARAAPHDADERQSGSEPPLLIKQFSGGHSNELWLDWQMAGDLAPNGWRDNEGLLSILCGWVVQADAGGQSYGLRLPQRELPPGAGPGHRLACLQALACHDLPEER